VTANSAGPRVLVTNDDGIDSPGLVALARSAVELGWETIVAAPASESSGTSAGLVAAENNNKIILDRRSLPGLETVEAYALAAHPALITIIALREGLGDRPTIVLSGVNRGANIGRSVLHSGTVGAALTGAINGARAMAVSLDLDLDADTEVHWATATAVVTELLPALAAFDPGSVVNLNVPNRSVPRLRPLRWAPLSTYGRVHSRITRVDDGILELATIVESGPLEPDTDAALLEQGHPTITALHSVSENADLMNTDLPGLDLRPDS
jgi:5'-nucleotidase